MVMKTKKHSQGRQKIAIAKIPKRNNLQVTFSKRRTGLFKKASELCTLCGVEMAIIVFSPADKPFSFGHPEVDSILNRFLARNTHSVDPLAGSTCIGTPTTTQQLVEARRSASVHELNMEVTRIAKELEGEKKCGEAIDKMRKANEKQCWWEKPVEELGFHDLQILKASLEELKKNVSKQANRILMESSVAAGISNYPSSPSFFMRNNGLVHQDDDHHRLFEGKIRPADQIGPACSFGYAGHGLF